MIRKNIYTLLGIFFLLPFGLLAKEDGNTENNPYMENSLYIKFKNSSVRITKNITHYYSTQSLFTGASKSNLLQKYGVREYAFRMNIYDNPLLENVFQVDFDSTHLADSFIEELHKDSRIEYVEKVPQMRLQLNAKSDESPDIFVGEIEGIQTSWHLDMVGYSEIFPTRQGHKDIRVAIVDNAVWENHEDLHFEYDNVFDMISGVEGSASPPKGVNQLDSRPGTLSAAYSWSHGTHCAGLIGAIANNGKGIGSLASGVTLMGVRTSNQDATSLDRTVQGVIWAAENGAKVISMSFGSSGSSKTEENIYQTIASKGVILIAAAGNDGKIDKAYPGAYPGLICVASVNSDAKMSSFSNYGNWVDIAGPGGFYVKENGEIDPKSAVFSTTYCVNQSLNTLESFKGKFYDGMSGTSMATPIVSGMVGLILSYYPDFNGYQIKEILQRSAKKVSKQDLPIVDNSGIINAPKAFALLAETQDMYVKNLSASFTGNEKEVKISWNPPSTQANITYSLYCNDVLVAENIQQTEFKKSFDTVGGILIGVKAKTDTKEGLRKYTAVSPSGTPIEAITTSYVSFYLDASTDKLFIRGEKEGSILSVFDIQGRKMISLPYTSYGVSTDILKRGMYVGNINGKTFKFIK